MRREKRSRLVGFASATHGAAFRASASGNGDGFVCGIALGSRTTPAGNQLYDFYDNQLAP